MPNRIIKESIRTSERLNGLTDFQFRLWVSLITYVDDYGRGDARPAIIRGSCFPLRERITNKDIDSALTGLAGAGCVGLYTVDGKPYLYFPNWEAHQTIRNKQSKFPAPEASSEQSQAIAGNCKQLKSIASNCSRNPIQSESNPNPNPKEKSACAPASPLEKALQDYADMRRKLRAPLTDRAMELTLAELEKLAPGDDETKILILQQSVQKGWRGVFPLREAGKKAAKQPAEIKDDLDYLDRMIEKQKGTKNAEKE